MGGEVLMVYLFEVSERRKLRFRLALWLMRSVGWDARMFKSSYGLKATFRRA